MCQPSGSGLLQRFHSYACAIYHGRQSVAAPSRGFAGRPNERSSNAVPLLTQATVKAKDKWAAAPRKD